MVKHRVCVYSFRWALLVVGQRKSDNLSYLKRSVCVRFFFFQCGIKMKPETFIYFVFLRVFPLTAQSAI